MMKNLIWMFLIGSFVVFTASKCTEANAQQEPENYETMPWVKLGDVEALVKKNPKKIIVDVYTPWCGPCKMMDRNTFSDKNIINTMGKNFYPIKFNAEGPDPITFKGKEYSNPRFDPNRTRGRNAPHQLSSFFSVPGYPTLVVMDENMNILEKIVGYKTPAQLQAALSKYTTAN